MKINPGKSKALRFTSAWVKNPLGYSLDDQIPEDSSCKYLGIISQSDLNWVDQVNYRAQKAWKALPFAMQSSAYMSLAGPILEYGSACWDPCREGRINALGRVQTKAAQFTNHMKDSDWDTLA